MTTAYDKNKEYQGTLVQKPIRFNPKHKDDLTRLDKIARMKNFSDFVRKAIDVFGEQYINEQGGYNMAMIKVSELTGKALDYAVAVCEGGCNFRYDGVATRWITIDGKDKALSKGWKTLSFCPSVNWSEGGPIIEREEIDIFMHGRMCVASIARYQNGLKLVGWRILHMGDTPLIAAMRCYVSLKLGDVVDIPDCLL